MLLVPVCRYVILFIVMSFLHARNYFCLISPPPPPLFLSLSPPPLPPPPPWSSDTLIKQPPGVLSFSLQTLPPPPVFNRHSPERSPVFSLPSSFHRYSSTFLISFPFPFFIHLRPSPPSSPFPLSFTSSFSHLVVFIFISVPPFTPCIN